MVDRAWASRPASRFLTDRAFAKVIGSKLRGSMMRPSCLRGSRHSARYDGRRGEDDTRRSSEVQPGVWWMPVTARHPPDRLAGVDAETKALADEGLELVHVIGAEAGHHDTPAEVPPLLL